MSCYIVIYEENISEKNVPSLKTSFYEVFYAEKDGNILEEKKHAGKRSFISKMPDFGSFS